MALLELDDIHTFYGNIEALKGVSLTVEEGECVTLIGSNGAGKSTTLRSISALHAGRATGSIRFDGQRDHRARRRRTSSAWASRSRPEGRHCFPRMTVRENLDLGAYLRSDRDGHRAGHGPRLRAVPAPEGARAPEGGDDVRRRAADARDRARADGPARSCCCSTSRRWASRRSSSSASTRRSPRSTARARRSCWSSRTRTSRSTSPSRGYVLETGRVVLADASEALRENPEVQKAYLGT